MTAVENVSAFLTTQERKNSSPINGSQVAKKSTAKSSKYLSDLNNLSQKSADSYTSSSQNSGPVFIEDDSFGDEDLNGSGDVVVNGNGNTNNGDSEMLSDGEGEGRDDHDIKKDVTDNSQRSIADSNHVGDIDPDMSESEHSRTQESPVSSDQAPIDNSVCKDSEVENNVDNNGVNDPPLDDENSNSNSGTTETKSSISSDIANKSDTCSKLSVDDPGDKEKDAAKADEENENESELLSDNKVDEHSDSEIDDSILDDPETATKPKAENPVESTKLNGETSDAKLIKEDVEMKDVKSEDDDLKTDDVVIKHDIEMTEENDCDKDTKDSITSSDSNVAVSEDSANPKEEEEVADGKKINKNVGVKRSLSPENCNAAPKRSKLEEMIGRLSSSVGKKPEEAVNLDDEEVETDSSSESESSAENDKLVTLSTKDLNRIIRKRIDLILKVEKDKMQKKIEELQLNVDMWKTQAKELRIQLSEVSSKPPKEKKRPSLKRRRRPPRVDVGVDTSDFLKTVQAAQHQQGINSGAKPAPRAPTAPTIGRPTLGRPTAGNPLVQNAINVRNAQVRPTVKTLLENQRGVVGGIATAGTAPRIVRPTNEKTTASAKQLGGCIDLTDDDEKAPPSAKQQTAVRTLVQTSQLVSPVVQGPAGLGGSAVFLQGSPSGPLVLQPVTQGMRLSQQGNVVYASASGSPLVRPGMVPQLKPGQQMLVQTSQRSAATTVNRPPPPLKSAPSLQKHPAPLPPTPSSAGTYPKHPPPKPSLKISRVQQGIVLSWNMALGKEHADITNYQLFAYQETSASPSTNLWKKVGDVKALPLPMACTLTQFQEGNKYHFAVRAIDTHNRMGSFSEACSIHLAPSS